MLCVFGDGCTYYCERVFPFVDESPEAALVRFEDLYNKAKKEREKFSFAGEEFYPCDFEENGKYYAPQILTIDEWFEEV